MEFSDGSLRFTEGLIFADDKKKFLENRLPGLTDAKKEKLDDLAKAVSDAGKRSSSLNPQKRKNTEIHLTDKEKEGIFASSVKMQEATANVKEKQGSKAEKESGGGNPEKKSRAAKKTMVARMIRTKDMLEKNREQITGNALHDGNTGVVKILTTYVDPKTWSKMLAAKLGALIAPHILTVFVYLVTVFILITLVVGMYSTISMVTGKVTGYLTRYSGRGHILSEDGLTEEEIDEIVEDSGANEEQESVIRYALSKVGYPYSQEERASGSAYDCSSLAYFSWLAAGVDLSYGAGYPPTAALEASRLYSHGTAVSATKLDMRDLEPGDLVFYGGSDNKRFLGIYHVALYVGNGEVVEALNTEHGVVYETLRTKNIILVLRP